jgi:hypothetical protein
MINFFQKSGDYLAIPITINVVLIISDTLLIWASGARNRILIWPWMVIHFVEFLFFIAALIFAMIIVPEAWFKVRTRQVKGERDQVLTKVPQRQTGRQISWQAGGQLGWWVGGQAGR